MWQVQVLFENKFLVVKLLFGKMDLEEIYLDALENKPGEIPKYQETMEVKWCIFVIAICIILALMMIGFRIWKASTPQQYGMIVDVNESIDDTFPLFDRINLYSRNQLEDLLHSRVDDQASANCKIQIQCVDIQTTSNEGEDVI